MLSRTFSKPRGASSFTRSHSAAGPLGHKLPGGMVLCSHTPHSLTHCHRPWQHCWHRLRSKHSAPGLHNKAWPQPCPIGLQTHPPTRSPMLSHTVNTLSQTLASHSIQPHSRRHLIHMEWSDTRVPAAKCSQVTQPALRSHPRCRSRSASHSGCSHRSPHMVRGLTLSSSTFSHVSPYIVT